MESLRLGRGRAGLPRACAWILHALAWPLRVVEARRIMSQLGGLADHELRDIGLTRFDLQDVGALPRDADPSLLLRRRAEQRRRWR